MYVAGARPGGDRHGAQGWSTLVCRLWVPRVEAKALVERSLREGLAIEARRQQR